MTTLGCILCGSDTVTLFGLLMESAIGVATVARQRSTHRYEFTTCTEVVERSHDRPSHPWVDYEIEGLRRRLRDALTMSLKPLRMLASRAGGKVIEPLGPIIPIGAELLALTPISPFRPRRWRGALLPNRAAIRFEILEPDKRSCSAVADFNEVRDVCSVEVRQANDVDIRLLFDPTHLLDERILREQFLSADQP